MKSAPRVYLNNEIEPISYPWSGTRKTPDYRNALVAALHVPIRFLGAAILEIERIYGVPRSVVIVDLTYEA